MRKSPAPYFVITCMAIFIVVGIGLYFFPSQQNEPLPAALPPKQDVVFTSGAAAIERGRGLTRECMICHTMDEGAPARLGPNLFGIVGAHHAHMQGYPYSKSLASMAHKIWTLEALDQWLKSPTAYAPGTKMAFPGFIDAKDRNDIIAYLKTLKNE